MSEKELVENMLFKNEEEINEMFNSGMFNEIVKGYVSIFLKQEHSGVFGDDAIKIAMRDMDRLFDEVSSKEAREYYKRRYCKWIYFLIKALC